MQFTYDTRPAASGGGGGSGTVTEVDSGTGLTGGPITVTGTLSLADIDDGKILSNISGSSAAPIPNTLSHILDYVFDAEQGDILFRSTDLGGWTVLSPGTQRQSLVTGGTGDNPAWRDTSSFYTDFDICVTVIDGDDGNVGSPLFPVATIDQALVLAGTPSSYLNIRILDSETYTGTWNVTGMINFIGETATLTQTDGSDCLVFETSGIQHLVAVGAVINTAGGAPIANTGTSSVVVEGGALVGPTRTSSGNMFINNIEVVGNIGSIGDGFINYTTSFRSGTDGTNVIGWSPSSFAELAFNGSQIYFSQVAGNDSWTGSLTNPLATINAAITLWTSYPDATIIGLDNANYDEQITTPSGMTIYAPGANISSSVGDTITNTGSGVTVTFNSIQSGGGNAITNNAGYPNFNFIYCFGGNFVNVSGGYMVLNATTIATDISNPGHGSHGSETVLTLQEGPPGSVDAYTYSPWSNSLPIFGGGSVSLPFNNVGVYFSQLIGNDANSGSYTSPTATINAALTIATTVSAENPPIIYGLDNAAYDEQLSLGDNVTITAPQATISSSAGDTITFTGNLSTVTFAVIESSATNPITQTGSGFNVANFQESNNWGTTGFDNTGSGTLCLNFYQTSVPIVSTSGGIINLCSPTFPSGTAPTGKLTGIAGGVNYGLLNAGYGGSYAINVSASVSHTQVASAGHAPLIVANSSTASYVISNIYLNRGSNFSGTSSDRNLSITDGTVVWTIVPEATLKSAVNAVWGSTAVPFPATFGLGAVSVPGNNIYAVYSGGSVDYVSGNIDFNILYSQVTN